MVSSGKDKKYSKDLVGINKEYGKKIKEKDYVLKN